MKSAVLDDEVFLDCGAFNGRTSKLFADWCKNKYEKIYAFEPEENNREKCRDTLQEAGARFEIVPYGLWDSKQTFTFITGKGGASHIEGMRTTVSGGGTTKIDVDALDNILKGKRASFIKMDLEGSELHALKGAKEIIKIYRPKLAISIYHKPEDMWELPDIILSYHSDYKLYIRHYSIAAEETIMYAI